ncbi:hypothetical protein JHK85_017724 [Glycine max]|nr:hypothetical protein JHK85_017724 [Glycine max]
MQTWVCDREDENVMVIVVGSTLGKELTELCEKKKSQRTRKKDIIEIFFHADTVWKIQNIPLLNVQDDDQLMWRFSHNGIDTVRSASNNIMEAMLDNDHLKVPGKWNIQAPPKIKHFVWRLLRGCLPTMQRLVQKGIDYVLQNAVSAATTLRMIGTCSLIAQ